MRKLFCILLCFVCLFATQKKQHAKKQIVKIDPKKEIQKVYQKLDNLLKVEAKKKGFNGVVLIDIKDNLHYASSTGYEKPELKRQHTKSAVFQLASVSKQFTAVSVIKLREAGKLDYEDAVTKFFPNFPYKDVKIHNLLNHTSGLPNYMSYFETEWKQNYNPSNYDVIRWLINSKPDKIFRTGESFSYSNTGYVVLASIVEKVSKKKFSDYLRDEIFKPAGMTSSFLFYKWIEKQHLNKMMGYGHSRKGLIKIPDTINDGMYGDKGVYSSVLDLINWSHALDEGKIISTFSFKKAGSKTHLKNGKEINYGYGFRVRNFNGGKLVYHFGKWNGFRTYIGKYLSKDATIIVLNNSNQYIKWLIEDIESILWEGHKADIYDIDEQADE